MTEEERPDDRPPGDPVPPDPSRVDERVEAAGEEPAEPAEPEERRYPSTIGGALYLGILVTTTIGFGIILGGSWRLGIRWLAGSLLAAAALRLVLRQRDAGMLAVRHRFVDCTLLTAVGAALLFLAETIPEQPL